jgi:hypothetical protein
MTLGLRRDRTRSYTPGPGNNPAGRGVMRARWMWLAIVVAAAVATVTLSADSALAQRKKITLDELVIEGNIQKPQAFFILPRTNLNFSDLERREDLKSRIVKSVEKAPF